MRKNFNELSSSELSELLSEYRNHKVETMYGWMIEFSIKWFYENKHEGFFK